MADDRSDDGRDWESLKLYFEFFKHFTTLATASGLIFLALLRELDLSTRAAVFGLSMLAGSLFLSLFGMLGLLVRATDPAPFRVSPRLRPGYPTFVLAAFVMGFFFTGVVALVG